MDYIFAHLEYFVAGAGVIISVWFVNSGKKCKHPNDLTPMVMRLKRHQEAVNKKSKSIL